VELKKEVFKTLKVAKNTSPRMKQVQRIFAFAGRKAQVGRGGRIAFAGN
jgi:hypothetical protein